jgi:DNA/RNA endonuclease YhcR with UshA esterase domain
MRVRATGLSKNQQMVFLNSEADYTSEKNFAVVIRKGDRFPRAGIADPAAFYAGKAVRVTGTVSLYNDRPEIVVTDPEQIRVVDEP